jgi:hypothetical protein
MKTAFILIEIRICNINFRQGNLKICSILNRVNLDLESGSQVRIQTQGQKNEVKTYRNFLVHFFQFSGITKRSVLDSDPHWIRI